MHIHILGICGTFMGGIAVLAQQQGFHVTGSDDNVYPPMSTQLEELGISLLQGYEAAHLSPEPDYVIVGNAMSRGNPAIEAMLNHNMRYISGPQWLAEHILNNRWVIAVAGTHGKTTTTSILTWILEFSGLQPGFLIGGVPENFGVSARLGESPYFVIEADEYDTAFFDKRSKFIHYHPRTLIMNNLEYDHADIFPNIQAIQQQFHYLVRTVPGNGLIINSADDENLSEVLNKGCWTPIETIGGPNALWYAQDVSPDASEFTVYYDGKKQGKVSWSLLGKHNVHNALAAIAAAHHVGVPIEQSLKALSEFKNVKRRLEMRGIINGITIYDDFAHHPTAIATTLEGLRGRVGKDKIIAVTELGSNTMRSGAHRNTLAPAFNKADKVLFLRPQPDWGIDEIKKELKMPAQIFDNVNAIINELVTQSQKGDHIVIMSNKGFGDIHQKLLTALQQTTPK